MDKYTSNRYYCTYNHINYNDIYRSKQKLLGTQKSMRVSRFDYDPSPDSEEINDLHKDANPLNSSNIEDQYDSAFYHALKKIQWHLFLSIKFRTEGLIGESRSSMLMRREFVRKLFRLTINKLELNQNDLQYFAFEERNLDEGNHLHIVVHCKHPEKASVEATRQVMLQALEENGKFVIIPPDHSKHIQLVDHSERVLRYCLKLKLDENEKSFFHSLGFIRFYHRHLNWLEKKKSQLRGVVISKSLFYQEKVNAPKDEEDPLLVGGS
jgi:hypothetical protein